MFDDKKKEVEDWKRIANRAVDLANREFKRYKNLYDLIIEVSHRPENLEDPRVCLLFVEILGRHVENLSENEENVRLLLEMKKES